MVVRRLKPEQRIVNRFLEAQNSLVLQASDLSLETIASMVDAESIDIEPQFQRRQRWELEVQSGLIESFLLNIPVPPVYLSEEDFGVYSVIDGKQRISAIHSFMRNKLKLEKLTKLKEIQGFQFKALPNELKNALSVRPYLRVVTLLKQTDPDLKYEVFTRLNKSGVPLNSQEIRNVLYRGPLNDLIFKLAQREFLRKQLNIKSNRSPAYRKMEDAKLVLHFFTLEENWQNFSGELSKSMDRFMGENHRASPKEINKLKQLFDKSLEACEKIWGEAAFKRQQNNKWRNQLLVGMWDAQMISVSQLTNNQIKRAIQCSKKIIGGTKKLLSTDDKFNLYTRQGTNIPARVSYRVRKIHQLLLDSI